MSDITENIKKIREEIKGSNAKLIAVSKFRTKEEIIEAIKCGQKIFGENRVQEALAKWPDIKKEYPDIELHLIGSLQTNKAKEALSLFDYIEVIDRENLVDKFIAMGAADMEVKFLVQINTGSEPQKSGVLPENTDNLLKYCKDKGLKISGLMCIPPEGEDPKPHFDMLRKIADKHNLPIRSMGMSSDYKIAAEYGSTHIRVGTAIFGTRNY